MEESIKAVAEITFLHTGIVVKYKWPECGGIETETRAYATASNALNDIALFAANDDTW